jgi:uncharacterized protein
VFRSATDKPADNAPDNHVWLAMHESDEPNRPNTAPVSELYGAQSRALQDHFDSRRLADFLARRTVHPTLTADDTELIERQSTVWLSTVDSDGWPDVSYKGGHVGFVEVVDPETLRIPIFDGNGMFRTLGNIVGNPRVALLFIDQTRPWRMRVHGTATVSTDTVDTAHIVGSQAVVIVTIARIFPNCGRYIHPGDSVSEFVPVPGTATPDPEWKLRPGMREFLPEADQIRLNEQTVA